MNSSRAAALRVVWLAVLTFGAAPLAAQSLAPIRYAVSFASAHTHYVDVEASIPLDGQPQVELMMPVWTPGSYLVREYARNVEGLSATDANGRTVSIEKTRKNRWRVGPVPSAGAISLRYRVYAHEMSVRTNWVDDEFALLNGAATYITRVEGRDRPYEVEVRLAAGWSRSVSGMTSAVPNSYRSPDYDTLVDSPIVAGNPAIYPFTVAGKPHYLVDVAERGTWDGARAVLDLQKIVEQTTQLWGSVPYDRFYFLNIIGGPANGLEHKNSVTLNTDRGSTGTRTAYLGWLNLASHEFFHAWNVKRLRPIELGPFDYENEVYTKSLWFAEGVTDYYAALQVHRAGVSTRDEYLSALSDNIITLQTTPGRLVQPAEMSSFDAWIKYYRPDENSANASVSYYTKGAVVGFLLDAKLRRITNDARTLDDLMKLMYERFSGRRGFTPDDLRAAAADIAGERSGADMRSWLRTSLDSTDELDYREALDWFGLQFKPLPEKPRTWLGIRTRLDGAKTMITEVRRGSPAADAGLDINDELAAVNDTPVAGKLVERLAAFGPGGLVTFTVVRRGASENVKVTLGIDPTQRWSLAVAGDLRSERLRHASGWLHD
jgi:predicted metalloprotease with PDZ domain